MSVSFDAYKVFYVTAKNESITAAAKELYVTQPTISHCIQKMEEELGCILFIRGKKGVELTPEGKILYNHVAIACEQIWEAENDLDQLKELEKGEIAIGAGEMTLHHFLFPYIKKYKQKYPSIRLKINNSSTPNMLTAIRENKLDCGILVLPNGYREEELEIRTLVNFQDIAIAGNEYKELASVRISLKDLISYPIISMEKGTISHQMLQNIFTEHHLELKPDIELATTDLIVPMVVNNLGIGFVPEAFAKEALKREKIFQLNLMETIPQRSICLVNKVGKPQSIAAEAFMDCIRDNRNATLTNPD